MTKRKPLDYRLRPHKHTERNILIDSIGKILGDDAKKYVYIGFGAEYYRDFILFHEKLNIIKMYSIESDNDRINKCIFNLPYGCIENLPGSAADIIPTLDYEENLIIWLDFTAKFNRSTLNDIISIVSQIKKDSIVLATFNIEYPMGYKEFCIEFGDYVPFNTINSDLAPKNYNRLVRKTLDNAVVSVFAQNNDAKKAIECFFDFVYADGTKMITIGYMLSEIQEINALKCKFATNKFLFKEKSYQLDLDILTPKEMMYLKELMPNSEITNPLPWCNDILESNELISKYKDIYMYYPSYSEVIN